MAESHFLSAEALPRVNGIRPPLRSGTMLRLRDEPGTVVPCIGRGKASAANRTGAGVFCRLCLLLTTILLLGCARLLPNREALIWEVMSSGPS